MGALLLHSVSLVSAVLLAVTGFGATSLEEDGAFDSDGQPDFVKEILGSGSDFTDPEPDLVEATIFIVPSEVVGGAVSVDVKDSTKSSYTADNTNGEVFIREGFAVALTEEGDSFQLTDDDVDLDDLVSGDEVLLTVKNESVADVTLLESQALSSIDTNPAESNAATDTITDQDSDPHAEARLMAAGPYAHTVDVLVLNDTNSKVSQQVVNNAIGNLSNFWNRESNGAISKVTVGSFQKRSTTNQQNPCDAYATWNLAKNTFGTLDSTYLLKNTKRHLVVITSKDECGGGGLATIGAFQTGEAPNLANGGKMWISVDYSNPQYWQQVLAHEFGHNLSLSHSNARTCNSPHNDGAKNTNGCINEEYLDYFDVMGRAVAISSGSSVVATSEENLPALNNVHKKHLGVFKVGNEIKKVSNSAGKRSATLNATSSSGVRGLSVTDPNTGEEFLIEYRSGTGFEKNSFYVDSGLTASLPGVRVLKKDTVPQSKMVDSLVLTKYLPNRFHTEPFFNTHGQSFVVGETFSAYNKTFTMTVKSMSNTKATVEFNFDPKYMVYKPKTYRASGPDRYATSVAVSKVGFPKKAPVVYIATGANYPDALAAGPAAAMDGGPLVLVPNNAKGLDGVIAQRLKELDPARVVVIGGKGAVSTSVLNRVKSILPKASVQRIGGADRYDTSLKVVETAFKGKNVDEVIVATGANFPDALAASGAAGARKIPVVLVNGNASKIDAKSLKLLKSLKVKTVYIAGGKGVVSAGIEQSLKSSFKVVRLGGSDRYATSQAINKKLFEGKSPGNVFFATGMNFPDALAASAVAGFLNSPLEVVPKSCVPSSTASFVKGKKIPKIYATGGKAVLTDSVLSLKVC